MGAEEHIADGAVAGRGHELIGARARAPRQGRLQHLGRFRWAIAMLFLLGVCSLAAAALLSTGSRHGATTGSSVAWSTFRPPDNGLSGAQEIADYLAPYYRADPANQLAVVTVVNLNNPLAPVQVVVPAGSTGALLPLPATSTVVYNLCGEGSSNCSIGVGTPSTNRLLLLRRESLELALYTFKYISGTQWVVAILPPGYTRAACTGVCARTRHKPITRPVDLAVVFDRSELTNWLKQPLRATLPEALPPTVSQMSHAYEAELVSVLTSQGMFSESTAQAQDGSTVISLSHVRPQ